VTNQAGLAEDDQKQEQVGPDPVLLDDLAEMAIQMEDDVHEEPEQIHGPTIVALVPARDRIRGSGCLSDDQRAAFGPAFSALRHGLGLAHGLLRAMGPAT